MRSNEPDVKGIVGKLTQGAVDAGFVYVTDVNATNGELKAIELPPEVEPQVTYAAGVVQGRQAARRRRRRTSTGWSTGPAPTRSQAGRVRRRALMRWFPVALALALAAALTFLTLPVVAIFVDSSPGRPDRQPRRPGRARRALAQPAHHRRRRSRSS